MSVKKVRHYPDVEDKILNAVSTIADPIKQTLGPRGGNVIFEDDLGDVRVTNDGVTIAKNIAVADPFEDTIIQVIKQSALKTNTQAGDGTSTTILLSSILIREGLKLINDGVNQRDVIDGYSAFAEAMKGSIEKLKKDVKNYDDLFNVAKISANNDEKIAKDVVKIIGTAGEDGYIFLEPSSSAETEIIEDTGFVIEQGLFSPEIINQPNGTAAYEDIPVLITDKRLYYAQEAETILNTVLQAGYKEVAIIAKDFIGEALPYFVANHQRGSVKVMLVKDPHVDDQSGATLTDLAAYLDGTVVSESQGKIVDKLSIEDFCMAKRAYADGKQTVIMRDKEDDDKRLKDRVKILKAEIKKKGDDDSKEKTKLKKRLASLTNGIVTVRIGGSTPIEQAERRFRYEDAISAGRAAVKDGYLVGGGLTMFRAQEKAKYPAWMHNDLFKIFRKVGEANIRQIAENAGAHPGTVVSTIRDNNSSTYGFNALTNTFEDLLESGIIDPFRVTKMAIENSVSIANAIVGSRYIIVNDKNKIEDGKSTTEGDS